jgi:hypothetical protein
MFKPEKDTRNWVIRMGDVLYDFTRSVIYHALYPLFSVIRASIWAIRDAWNDAE